MNAYERNEEYEERHFTQSNFVYFVPILQERRDRVSRYLHLAKGLAERDPSTVTPEEFVTRRNRKLEEASRRGLVVRWSAYPKWIALHDPLSGEWHQVRASDCLPSLVEAADRGRHRK